MKGEVRKFQYVPRTLDSDIVRDGLEAVNVLEGKEPYFLVGGIASQSYLPTSCRRPTSDIDFALVRSISKPEFRDMVAPIVEFLHDKGYTTEIQTSNRSRSYAITYSNNENDSCLEFARRNDQNLEKHKVRLQREFDNSRIKIIEGRTGSCRVCSPEDIAVPKLVRSVNTLRRNPHLAHYNYFTSGHLTDDKIKDRLKLINQIRDEVMANPGDPLIAEKLRFVSDLYDLRILSETTGFNQKYFLDAQKDWVDLELGADLRDKIIKFNLPGLLLHN